jgi:hypothetical protein
MKKTAEISKQVEIFNNVNGRFLYRNAEICRWSGFDSGMVSRFISGETDISASKFLVLVNSMPQDFRTAYWDELLQFGRYENIKELFDSSSPADIQEAISVMNSLGHIGWRQLIEKADFQDLPEILNAIADRYTNLYEASTKPQETVTASNQELCQT